jgi:hypothetical protein
MIRTLETIVFRFIQQPGKCRRVILQGKANSVSLLNLEIGSEGCAIAEYISDHDVLNFFPYVCYPGVLWTAC